MAIPTANPAPPAPGLNAAFARHRHWLSGTPAAAILLALYLILSLSAWSGKTATFDEPFHLAHGAISLTTGRSWEENGTLPERWAAFPVILAGFTPIPKTPADFPGLPGIGSAWLFHSGNDAAKMLFLGRSMIALLTVGLGSAVYRWSRGLFGAEGGILSLALFVLCPTLLSHGALITADAAAALFFLLGAGALWRLLHHVSPVWIALSCLAAGALFISKLSAVLLLPMALLMATVRIIFGPPLIVSFARRRREIVSRPRQAAIIATLALIHVLMIWLIVWTAYDFRHARAEAATEYRDSMQADAADATGAASPGEAAAPPRSALIATLRSWRLLPEAYIDGLESVTTLTAGQWNFFAGVTRQTGSPWFLPYCLAVKTPIGSLALVAIGLATLFTVGVPTPVFVNKSASGTAFAGRSWANRIGSTLYATAPLLILLAVYWCSSILAGINLGVRHILPTYPAMYILAGAAAYWLRPHAVVERKSFAAEQKSGVSSGRTAKRSTRRDESGDNRDASFPGPPSLSAAIAVSVLALVAWVAIDTALSWPNYLAYFNEFVGGSADGYRCLADSSLDWGQDLPGLADWLHDHARQTAVDAPGEQEQPASDRPQSPAGQNTPPIYLAYFGTASPAYYNIRATLLPCQPMRPDDIAGIARAPRGGIFCISATMMQVFTIHPWTDDCEQTYRALAVALIRRSSARAAGQPPPDDHIPDTDVELGQRFRNMIFSRLCAYLRPRAPDANIGHSILIYRLTDDEAHAALFGPIADDNAEPG
jgi:hypothetical protein